MLTYKRFLAFSISLLCVLVVGAANALFMTPNTEWFASLIRPKMNAEVHSLLWLLFYIITAIITAEFFIHRKLRRRILSVVIFLIANPVWCLIFFRLYSTLASVILLFLMVADLIYVTVVCAKHTKIHWIFCVALTCWYIYLAILNTVVWILNL